MKFLVVGCGSIGSRHLRNLVSIGENELIVVDPDPERRDAAKREWGAKPYPTFNKELAEIADVVFVTLPSSSHLEVATLAAKSGCHLFVEKPLACSLDGVDELLDSVRQNRLVGFLGSNWKFHPALRRIKDLLEEEVIGRVLTARFIAGQYLPDWHPWEDYRNTYSARESLGGGVIFDSHELDYASWFLGPVKELVCFSGNLSDLEIDTEDVASMLLKFKSGAIAQIQLDYLCRNYTRRYEFFGAEGTILWDVHSRMVELYEADGGSWRRWDIPRNYDNNSMFVDELQHFLNCIKGVEEPVTSLEMGREVLTLLLSAHQSNRERRVLTQ